MAHTTHYSSTLFTFEIKIYNANAKQHNTTTTRQSCIVFGRATSVSTRPNLGLEPEIAQASKVHDHDHEVEVRSHGNESQRSNNFLKLGVPRPVTCDRWKSSGQLQFWGNEGGTGIGKRIKKE